MDDERSTEFRTGHHRIRGVAETGVVLPPCHGSLWCHGLHFDFAGFRAIADEANTVEECVLLSALLHIFAGFEEDLGSEVVFWIDEWFN